MTYWILYCALLVSVAWLLTRAAIRSWGRPERFDASWMWTRPAPCLAPWPLGPLPAPARLADAPTVAMEHVGATLTSPSLRSEIAIAERARLPLDDVDEWLAVRLSAFDHRIMEIGAATRGLDGSPRPAGWTVDDELDAFQRGSMALHEYRSMILDGTGSYGPREHMQLEQLLAVG
jgi:hypothetical protein